MQPLWKHQVKEKLPHQWGYQGIQEKYDTSKYNGKEGWKNDTIHKSLSNIHVSGDEKYPKTVVKVLTTFNNYETSTWAQCNHPNFLESEVVTRADATMVAPWSTLVLFWTKSPSWVLLPLLWKFHIFGFSFCAQLVFSLAFLHQLIHWQNRHLDAMEYQMVLLTILSSCVTLLTYLGISRVYMCDQQEFKLWIHSFCGLQKHNASK